MTLFAMNSKAFVIREAMPEDIPGIARVHSESWRTTYPGIVPAAILERLTVEQRIAHWQHTFMNMRENHEFVYVACVLSGEIIGFASGGPQRDPEVAHDGELYAIYLLQAYQRQGIGRALTLEVTRRLQRDGYRAMVVWVLAENPARQFYEGLGGRLLKEQALDFDGTPVMEVCYGWPDLAAFPGMGS